MSQIAAHGVDPTFLALPLHACADAATATGIAAGATHVDIRIISNRTGLIAARDARKETSTDDTALSMGVRVIVDGCWGFAASDVVTPESASALARTAVALARVSLPLATQPVVLAPEPVHSGTWISAYEIDPFEVAESDRLEVLTERSAALMSAGVDHVDAWVRQVRECTYYADSTGTHVTQQRVRIEAQWDATAIDSQSGAFETMSTTAPPVGRGWEYVIGGGATVGGARPWDWNAELQALPGFVREKLTAPSVEPGRYTLVIHPTNLWLTIHESIGHATELDRALGYEANYAGTSFATTEKLGNFKYGSPLMHVTGDRQAVHGLASVGWDSEGVAAQQWDIVKDGTLVGYQLDRAMAQEFGYERSNGCAFADSGEHVPIQRMPNVSLQPSATGPSSAEALIAGVEDGIYIVGDKSWSIDMQRYNFQFTGQRFMRIKNGQLAGQVKDVAYQSRTPDFWGSMIAVGGPDTYLLGGALNCGKGQPGQVAPVSHGCPVAVFENINILNTSAEAGA
ncbi:MAG: TldD/PmbA family protein [Actinobacteria bacterium]|nr:TldD/PmbA family protein [Actinomycetota bacterium]